MSVTPAGWYPNGDDWETYWDGAAWTDQHRARGTEVASPAADAEESAEDAELHAGDGKAEPLLSFVSHITGKNARVHVWPDRLEWEWRGRMGAGAKAGLAVMTVGLSYAKTGFTRKQSTEVIPIRSITSVTAKKGKGFQTILQVIAAGNTIDMRISHKEAETVRATLMQLVNWSHPSQQATPVRAPAATSAPAPASPADIAGPLQQLASLRDAGILTEHEFNAKKAELLARM